MSDTATLLIVLGAFAVGATLGPLIGYAVLDWWERRNWR